MAAHASAFQEALPRTVAACALPFEGTRHDHDALLHAIGDSTLVLLGEASHGTHEFYSERARLTRRLIEEKGFCAVAVEADWPDAYRINRFVRGRGPDPGALESLGGFERFPAWMWRNTDVLDFVKWLREHNDAYPHRAAGFYGLDLYSMNTSIEAVLAYLDRIDPEGAEVARRRYGCFELFGHDTQAYGYATSVGMAQPCEDEVVRQLLEIERRAPEYARRGPDHEGEDEAFFAEQNARLVKNAERYYRAMFRGGAASWNLRDEHMAETLDALRAHLGRHRGDPAKVVVWAHNSHLGDARATEMSREGELNVGQIVKERHPDVFSIGFTTYAGMVSAASGWGSEVEQKRVRPARPDSYEALLHATGLDRFALLLHDPRLAQLHAQRLERAIGVVYLPASERASHYFYADLAAQFDAVIHFDLTRAVEPLEKTARWEAGEAPETYPTGL